MRLTNPIRRLALCVIVITTTNSCRPERKPPAASDERVTEVAVTAAPTIGTSAAVANSPPLPSANDGDEAPEPDRLKPRAISPAPDLELTWLSVSKTPGDSSSAHHLSLLVRVDGASAQLIDIGDVPEPLPSFCLRHPKPAIQLRLRGPSRLTERLAVEPRGTDYFVRREERSGRPATWVPWRSYDPDAKRNWQFVGPTQGTYVMRVVKNGREMQCRPTAL